MASRPITSGEIDGETVETVRDFNFTFVNITRVRYIMMLKNACSLEEKL